ncbi:hypothetical protein MANAM107_18470 [Actinomyces capricornis]|uniref:Peptidase C39 domain-containing protein n=1 Tax=Actinomyces capricornis TaxID=2755559 RepID=A0ABN6K9H5_9ACTO|nr:hypothetical protein MANAM107_18470 [Actinomyces capricornis]
MVVTEPRIRVANSRLRVGRFSQAGDAVTMTQADATTCGAACLLAARLLLDDQEGRRLGRALDRGVSPGARPTTGALLAEALNRRQKTLQRTINSAGLWLASWPRALGSTPWAVGRAMSTTGAASAKPLPAGSAAPAGPRAPDASPAPASPVRPGRAMRYEVRWVRDHGPHWPEQVEEMRRQLARGRPALLLTGGPLRLDRGAPGLAGLSARACGSLVVPRHYVLALPWALIGQRDPGPGAVHLYEPGSGSVRALDLLAPRDPRSPGPRQLGGWPRILALLTPAEPD